MARITASLPDIAAPVRVRRWPGVGGKRVVHLAAVRAIARPPTPSPYWRGGRWYRRAAGDWLCPCQWPSRRSQPACDPAYGRAVTCERCKEAAARYGIMIYRDRAWYRTAVRRPLAP
jgi:hypothetical protein